jgi:hypothetical protein
MPLDSLRYHPTRDSLSVMSKLAEGRRTGKYSCAPPVLDSHRTTNCMFAQSSAPATLTMTINDSNENRGRGKLMKTFYNHDAHNARRSRPGSCPASTMSIGIFERLLSQATNPENHVPRHPPMSAGVQVQQPDHAPKPRPSRPPMSTDVRPRPCPKPTPFGRKNLPPIRHQAQSAPGPKSHKSLLCKSGGRYVNSIRVGFRILRVCSDSDDGFVIARPRRDSLRMQFFRGAPISRD